jgi:gamma-glutamyltranspeptidase/glutathione hydrolase
MKQISYLLLIYIFLFSCKTSRQTPLIPELHKTTKKAMVVSANPYASEAGTNIMKNGGNAVDALVATQFALAVVYPRAGNLGGGGFAVIRLPNGHTDAVDFRETAPKKAHKNLYLDKNGNVIPGLSTEGGLSIGVPGTVAGLYNIWNKYGRIKNWNTLLQPAITLAEKGFPISKTEAGRFNKYKNQFLKYNPDNKVFIKKNKWKEGDILQQKELANTLKLIAQNGPEVFYKGEIADEIVNVINKKGGIINKGDLENYKAKFRKPIEVEYRDYKIISMPPPSSGGITLGQLLSITQNYPISKWGSDNLKTIQLMVEAEKRAYADRAKFLGDSDFYPVPIDSLLNKEYLKNRMRNFDFSKATSSDSISAGKFILQKESFETTHTSIIDPEGMAVSCTTTLNSNFGSKVIVNKYGFFLNNEMDDFSAKPGVPNQFGLIGAEANSIAPGKRMLSSMTPTIVEKNKDIFMVLGSPGGSTIITSVYQVILNVIDFNMNIYQAVQKPRFHHQYLPDVIMYEEGRFDNSTIDSLLQKGYTLKKVKALGVVKAILKNKNGVLEGSGDHRNPDDDVEGF